MIKIGPLLFNEFPILLAPMEDVSDPPFRLLCKEHGADLMFTEFISIEGLIRDAEKSVKKLDIFESERPVGIQIFGAERESMIKAVKIINRHKPDIIDINFGCPVKKVVCKGAGAAILKDIDKMVSLTKEVVKNTNIPVTVKTRLGWDHDSIRIVEVAERLQDVGISALSIHGRTRVQMYKGEADWSKIAEVKKNPRIKIPIFCNGDIDTPQKAKRIKEEYGLDGAMIGRAAIGYPWIFKEIKHYLKTGEYIPKPSLKERIEALKKHLDFSIKWKGERQGILEMRRHYTNYFRGIDNIKMHRQNLINAKEKIEILQILKETM